MTETRVCDYCGLRIEGHPRDVDGLLREHKLHKHGVASVPQEVRRYLGSSDGALVTLGGQPMTPRSLLPSAVEDVPRGGPCRQDHDGNSGRGRAASACESFTEGEASRAVRLCPVVDRGSTSGASAGGPDPPRQRNATRCHNGGDRR